MDYPFPDKKYGMDGEDTMNVSSGQDCTGLIPANPDQNGAESYDEMYDFLPKAVSDGKNDGVEKR